MNAYAVSTEPVSPALLRTNEAIIVLQSHAASTDDARALAQPILRDTADVVIGRRPSTTGLDRTVSRVAAITLGGTSFDVMSGQLAIRTEALKALSANDLRDEVTALAALSGRGYRFAEVAVTTREKSSLVSGLAALRRSWQLLGGQDEIHDGHATLANLEGGAANYNAWLGTQFQKYAGRRILEIGAGIGTITAHLAPHAEKVIALEIESAYVERLHNRFRGQSNVEPTLSSAEMADWSRFKKEQLDTVVMSNVLEHIQDDEQILTACAGLLEDGGALLLYVPALPSLFGSLDTAVGHFRRYTPDSLKRVLEKSGFEAEVMQWRNALAIPGWWLNGSILKRTVLSPVQLQLYDQLAPAIARLENRVTLPVGLNLFCVARRRT